MIKVMISRYFLIGATALLLASCATPPLNITGPLSITQKKVNSITIGVTKRQDLKALFGMPETAIPIGKRVSHFYKDNNLSALWVMFGTDGTVEEFEYSE